MGLKIFADIVHGGTITSSPGERPTAPKAASNPEALELTVIQNSDPVFLLIRSSNFSYILSSKTFFIRASIKNPERTPESNRLLISFLSIY